MPQQQAIFWCDEANLRTYPTTTGRTSYQYDRFLFHCIVDSGLVFLCMAESEMGSRIPFCSWKQSKTNFMLTMTYHFSGTFLKHCRSTWCLSLCLFARLLIEFVPRFDCFQEQYNKSPDRLDRVRGEVDEVKNVMVANVGMFFVVLRCNVLSCVC